MEFPLNPYNAHYSTPQPSFLDKDESPPLHLSLMMAPFTGPGRKNMETTSPYHTADRNSASATARKTKT